MLSALGETRHGIHSEWYRWLEVLEGVGFPMSSVGLDMGTRVIMALLPWGDEAMTKPGHPQPPCTLLGDQMMVADESTQWINVQVWIGWGGSSKSGKYINQVSYPTCFLDHSFFIWETPSFKGPKQISLLSQPITANSPTFPFKVFKNCFLILLIYPTFLTIFLNTRNLPSSTLIMDFISQIIKIHF